MDRRPRGPRNPAPAAAPRALPGRAAGVRRPAAAARARRVRLPRRLPRAAGVRKNFYAGYTGRAVAQLLVTLFVGWLVVPLLAVAIWNVVEVVTVTKDGKGVPFR